jgi:Ca2+-binding EF-hand superfamily protein
MNVRKRIMRAIYTNEKEIITLKELQNVVNQASSDKLSEDEVSRVMNEMIIDFYGDIDFDKSGQVIYKFTRLREEMSEIQKLRGEQNTDRGRIVFQSS